MGFRMRKNVNIGGGFKINLSKSGVGYSWGTKGYRVTKKSTGGTRTTVSIPGTGLSYVSETGKKRGSSSPKNSNPDLYNQNIQNHVTEPQKYDTRVFENNIASEIVSDGLEEMIVLAAKKIRIHKFSAIVFWLSLILGCFNPLLWLISVASFIFRKYYKRKKTIYLDYSIDSDIKKVIAEKMQPLIQISQCEKTWRVAQTSKVVETKYSSGASELSSRELCKVSTKSVFPFATNEQAVSFKTSNEILLFLPDKLFILQGSKVGALNYSDVNIEITGTRYIETGSVPADSVIIDSTWEYVNKSGGPDKRFKNNRELPVCYYGKMEIKSDYGLNTVIMFSNINAVIN